MYTKTGESSRSPPAPASPRRWVVERSFGWLARFRRLARDYERLPETLAGACISSPLPSSCSTALPLSSLVHNSSPCPEGAPAPDENGRLAALGLP